ncbi:MAG: hypothetical protein JNN21_05665 [Candidatus Accumulibacter sp.]|nr:hypothetical protein [Accumulibacter sp.]
MNVSPYFEELTSAYDAELDDLMTDSAGHDILARRLQVKRSQVGQLLPMIECNPEMVAVAFHGGFSFANPAVMTDLAAREPEDLPAWQTLLSSVSLEPWAAELARVVLKDANGEHFLVVTACLEFLRGARTGSSAESARQQQPDGRDVDDEENADLDIDLEEAGADWLSEQGFDRKDRFAGDS